MSRARLSAWSLVAAAACWGTATAISKRAVDEIAPLTLLPIQLTVRFAVLDLGKDVGSMATYAASTTTLISTKASTPWSSMYGGPRRQDPPANL